MQKTKLMVAVLGALCAMPVLAADAPASAFTPSANVTIINDYLYRGITQTGNNAALQGGFDLAHSSGAYAGVWASSISWISDTTTTKNVGTEFDTYAGYRGEVAGVSYDVGFLRYNYPGDYGTNATADTNEVYVAATYSFLTAKYSYSLTDLFGTANSKGSKYPELNATYDLEAAGVTLGAHYGKQIYTNEAATDVIDYKVSVSKDFSGYVVGLAYSKTDVDGVKARGIVSLSRAF